MASVVKTVLTSCATVVIKTGADIVGGIGGERDLHLTLHCHHHNDSGIEMGGDVSHFNVSLSVRGKVTRQCP